MVKFDYSSNDLGRYLYQGISSRTKTKMGGLSLNTAPAIDSSDGESKKRTPGIISKPKLSALAQMIDDIYENKVSVYSVAKSLVIEIRHSSSPALFCMIENGKTAPLCITVEDADQLTPRDADFAAAIFFSSKKGEEMNEALLDYFKACNDGYPSDPSIYRFCDSYYYGFIKQGGTISVQEDKTLKEEFKSAVTGGMAEFNDLGLKGYITDEYHATDYEATSSEEEKAPKKAPGQTFIDSCRDGQWIVQFDWSEEQKACIEPMSYLDDFQETEEFEEIVKAIYLTAQRVKSMMESGVPKENVHAFSKTMLNGMLLGKPGTGKTAAMHAASAACQMPVYVISYSKHSEEDLVEGKTKIVDGKPQFIETDIPHFFDKGGLFVLEEPTLADAGVTMALSQLLEDPYVDMKNGYEKIYRHPLSFFFACENTGIEGTNPNSPAFSNRFRRKWVLDDPTEEVFKAILMKKTGQSKPLINWIYKAYQKITNWLKSPEVGEEEICNNLSLRSCEGTVENMLDGQTPIRAVQNSLVSAVAECDLELGRKLMEEVVESLPSCTAKVKMI